MSFRPAAAVGMPLAEVDTPCLILELDAFERNLRRLPESLAGRNIQLRPHAKSHKCPEIAHRQLALGAVGVCCQKVSEAEAMVDGGIHDVLIANEVVGADKLRRLAALAKRATIKVCADDAGNVHELDAAARAAGVDVGRTRLVAMCISGAVGGLGGVHLAFDQHRFEAGMSAGRGFIALAAVVLSGWLPGRAVLACLAFAFLESLQFVLQDVGQASRAITLVQVLPYAAALVALGLGVGRRSAPGGLGRHADD
jgi:hypothetical protein